MYYDLTKSDKKIARKAIDKGLYVQYAESLKDAEAIIAEWRSDKLGTKEAYHKLYSSIIGHDKKIGRRYNDLGGSKYLITVAAILYDGLITEEDVKDFSDAAREMMNRWISFWRAEE